MGAKYTIPQNMYNHMLIKIKQAICSVSSCDNLIHFYIARRPLSDANILASVSRKRQIRFQIYKLQQ